MLIRQCAFGAVALAFPAGQHMARQAAIDRFAVGCKVHVHRRLRRPVPRLTRNIKRVTLELRRRLQGQHAARQGHDSRVFGAAGDFGIRQFAVGGTVFKHIVYAPEFPHALREMRIQVAVKNRVAGGQVLVTRTAEFDLIAEGGAGRNRLRVEVGGTRCAGVLHPLVRVQVKHMGFFRTRMQIAKTHWVVQVRVVNVRGVVRVHRADRFFALCVPLQHQRWIAVGPRAQKKFFGTALGAVFGRAGAAIARDHHRAHTAHAVIDAHAVLDGVQRIRLVFQFGKGLHRLDFVVHHDRELPVGVAARVAEGIVGARPVGAGGVVVIRPRTAQGDDGIDVGVHDLVAVQHGEYRPAALGAAGVARAVVVEVGKRVALRTNRCLCGRAQVRVADLRAIPFGVTRLHVDGTEQAGTDLATVAFSADGGGGGIGEIGAFAKRIHPVNRALPGQHLPALFFKGAPQWLRRCGVDAGRVQPHAVAVGAAQPCARRGGYRAFTGRHRHHVQPIDMKRSGTRPRPVVAHAFSFDEVATGRRGVGLVVAHAGRVSCMGRHFALVLLGAAAQLVGRRAHQQVVKAHFEAVAFIGPQHDGPGPLVASEFDFAGRLRKIGRRDGRAVGHVWMTRKNHVAPKREKHAGRVERTVAIEHDGLLDSDHLGLDEPLTAWLRSVHSGCCREQAEEDTNALTKHSAFHAVPPFHSNLKSSVSIRFLSRNAVLCNGVSMPQMRSQARW